MRGWQGNGRADFEATTEHNTIEITPTATRDTTITNRATTRVTTTRATAILTVPNRQAQIHKKFATTAEGQAICNTYVPTDTNEKDAEVDKSRD